MAAATVGVFLAALAPAAASGASAADSVTINLISFNDFHGRIDSNTVRFAGTIEKLRAEYGDENSVLLSAGDSFGASLFASFIQQDQPTLDVLNALDLRASAVGNHEFDAGFSDLTGRVDSVANWDYLGANVYVKGTTQPALPEYSLIDVSGITVGVVGVVTKDVPALVNPGGISTLSFGDPVAAMNRVSSQLTDGDPSNGEADVVVGEYHEGTTYGEPATLEQRLAADATFREMVQNTSPVVDVIFTGHTHRLYDYDAPVPGDTTGRTRPVVQGLNYGEFVSQVVLEVDPTTKKVDSYSARNVQRTTDSDASLISAYPRVAEVDTITQAALLSSGQLAQQPVGSVAKDITSAFGGGTFQNGIYTGGGRDDRASESTLGNLVADAMVAVLGSADRGAAEIGFMNPGGLRSELFYGEDGVVTYGEANAVLPFANNLWTADMTGAQVKMALEQQWQRTANGTVPGRSFLKLGVSSNLSYTYDASRAEGDRIVSISVNNAPIRLEQVYRVGTFSFLLEGGDNFHAFAQATSRRDSGLLDRDAWVSFLSERPGLSPDFARRAVAVSGFSTEPATRGEKISFSVADFDLSSLGSPLNTEVAVAIEGSATEPIIVPILERSAGLTLTVPFDAPDEATIVVRALPSGTTARLPMNVVNPQAPDTKATPAAWTDMTPEKEHVALLDKVTYAPGDTITATLPESRIGTYVSAWMWSEPIQLGGWHFVGADRTLGSILPQDLELGTTHQVAIQDSRGRVIAWQTIRIEQAPTSTPSPTPTPTLTPVPTSSGMPSLGATKEIDARQSAEKEELLAATGASDTLYLLVVGALFATAGIHLHKSRRRSRRG